MAVKILGVGEVRSGSCFKNVIMAKVGRVDF